MMYLLQLMAGKRALPKAESRLQSALGTSTRCAFPSRVALRQVAFARHSTESLRPPLLSINSLITVQNPSVLPINKMETPTPVALTDPQKRALDSAEPSVCTPTRPASSTTSTPLTVVSSLDTPSPLKHAIIVTASASCDDSTVLDTSAPTSNTAVPSDAQQPAKRRKLTQQEKESKAKALAEKRAQKEAEDKAKADQKAQREEKKRAKEKKQQQEEEEKRKKERVSGTPTILSTIMSLRRLRTNVC